METEQNLSTRVTALEVNLNSLTDTVKELSNVVRTESITVSKHIADLSDKFAESQTPKWGNLIAFAMLVIVLIGAITTPVWMGFDYINEKSEKQSNQIKYLLDKYMQDSYRDGQRDAEIENLKNERYRNSLSRS